MGGALAKSTDGAAETTPDVMTESVGMIPEEPWKEAAIAAL